MGDPTNRLLELDARHGELLDRLAVLDEQIESVLLHWTRPKEETPNEPAAETVPIYSETKRAA
ncbi:MAG: hypothetical protein LBN39_02270 [Planctomycetaceae bacterium]|jgi:hypothetical protein|nr:hypothetical protein [Planctomycetaceae bacterium]